MDYNAFVSNDYLRYWLLKGLNSMRLLFYSWQANNEPVFIEYLKSQGNEVIIYDKPCRHYTKDLELASDMIMFINTNNIECVVSFNYFPIVSMICNASGIDYYSWVYDCPHHTLFSGAVNLKCNHIGIFDRELVKNLKMNVVNTVFHLPLAVDTQIFSKSISHSNIKGTDISFVGSLYTGKHGYFDFLDVSEKTKQDTFEVIEKELFNYKSSCCIPDSLCTEWIEVMAKEHLLLGDEYFVTDKELVQTEIIERKMTSLERASILEQIARKYTRRFALYTNSDTTGKVSAYGISDETFSLLDKCNRGIVDYKTEMPSIFNKSKINLNITLRSIHSGIPLRVLDIMGCGGFVLSNYQPELAEFFEEDKEVVLFNSMEECLEKIEYYLQRDDIRNRIANNGYLAVKERFNYENVVKNSFANYGTNT